MADTFKETLLSHVCSRFHVLIIIFSVALLFFLLSLVSLSVVGRGSKTFVIVVMNLVGLGVFIVVSGISLVICRDHI